MSNVCINLISRRTNSDENKNLVEGNDDAEDTVGDDVFCEYTVIRICTV